MSVSLFIHERISPICFCLNGTSSIDFFVADITFYVAAVNSYSYSLSVECQYEMYLRMSSSRPRRFPVRGAPFVRGASARLRNRLKEFCLKRIVSV